VVVVILLSFSHYFTDVQRWHSIGHFQSGKRFVASQSAQVRRGQMGQRAQQPGSGQNQGNQRAGQEAGYFTPSVRSRAVLGR